MSWSVPKWKATPVTRRIMERTGMKYYDARLAQKLVMEALVSLLVEGNRVIVPELGKFYLKRGPLNVPLAIGANAGKRRMIEVSYLRFKAGIGLKRLLTPVVPKEAEPDDEDQAELPFPPVNPSPGQTPAADVVLPSSPSEEAAAGAATPSPEGNTHTQPPSQSTGSTCETGG